MKDAEVLTQRLRCGAPTLDVDLPSDARVVSAA